MEQSPLTAPPVRVQRGVSFFRNDPFEKGLNVEVLQCTLADLMLSTGSPTKTSQCPSVVVSDDNKLTEIRLPPCPP